MPDKISSRLYRVDNEIYWRKQEQSKHISWKQFLFLSAGVLFTVSAAGFFMLTLGLGGGSPVEISDDTETFHVLNYTIHYVPEDQPPLEGGTRGKYFYSDEREFYVEQGHGLGLTERICRHEHMHDLGLVGEEAHRFVYRNDARVESRVCDRFIEMVKGHRAN